MDKYCESSGSQTASALIKTGDGLLHGIMIATDGSSAVTLDIHDGITATGTKLTPTTVIPTSATDRRALLTFPIPIVFRTGLYITVTVAGQGTCAYIVYHKKAA